jgi:hypothetical protein
MVAGGVWSALMNRACTKSTLASSRRERFDERLHHLARVLRSGAVAHIHPLQRQLTSQVLEKADALLADTVEIDRIPPGLERLHSPARFLDEIGVEATSQPAIGREQYDCGAPGSAFGRWCRLAEQGETIGQVGSEEVRDDLAQRLRIGSGGSDPVLSTLQLRRGHQLHRLGDFPGISDGPDPALELPTLSHAGEQTSA